MSRVENASAHFISATKVIYLNGRSNRIIVGIRIIPARWYILQRYSGEK